MISTGFAPNATLNDARVALGLFFSPWDWNNPKYLLEAEVALKKVLGSKEIDITFYLTGRNAFLNFLKVCKFPKASEVVVQAFTCEAVVLPIIDCGLKPVYADIEKETYSFDIINLRRKITNKTKLIVLQHTFALAPKYRDEILKLAKDQKIDIIEDIAHGFSQKLVSETSFLKSTKLLSFGRSKAFSSVFGGAISTSDKKLAGYLKKTGGELRLPSETFILKSLLYIPFSVFIKFTYDIFLGKLLHKIFWGTLLPLEITAKEKQGKFDEEFDYKYPPVFAKLLLLQLERLLSLNKTRVKNTILYSKFFKKDYNDALLRYPVLVADLDKVAQKAKAKNIFLGDWYRQVVAPIGLDLGAVFYKKGMCPVAEEVSKKIINLPTFVSEDEAKRVLEVFE